MRNRNSDYNRALSRTNLAVRCWLRWAEPIPKDVEKLRAEHRRVLAWLLANHIVQGYYRRCGIDVRPFLIGGMYGYGYAVGVFGPICLRQDIGKTAWVACGSVRVDPKTDQENGKSEPFQVAEAIAKGEDPLWVIDRATVVALGQRWLPKCSGSKCRHHVDAEVYLTLYQIITLLLCMGYLSDAILGVFVDCSEYGKHEAISHPLRLAGMIDRPCFTQDYFELGPTYKEKQAFAWIHRATGDPVLMDRLAIIPFKKWCTGSVETGMAFLVNAIG